MIVQTAPDEDANAYDEEMETQLHGQAASTGHKETLPSSYRDLMIQVAYDPFKNHGFGF